MAGVTLPAFDVMPEVYRLIHLADYDESQGKCPDCGRPFEECADPDVVWYPQRTICYATQELMVAQRAFDDIYDKRPWHDGREGVWTSESTPGTPVKYDDGVTLWVSTTDVNPDDNFLTSPFLAGGPDPDGGDERGGPS